MTIATGSFTTYAAKGIREDLSDIIYNISPTDTPMVSKAGKGTITNTFFEWQTDILAAASTTNQHLEGDDLADSYDSVTATVRLGNYAQISRKTASISATQDAVNTAGRKNELAYQITKKGLELKRDIAQDLGDNIACVAGSTTAARVTGTLLAFIKTNYDKDAATTIPSYTTTPNDAWAFSTTPRALTSTIVMNVLKQCYDTGAKVTEVLVGSFNKQAFSGISGISTQFTMTPDNKPTQLIGAASLYISDFGQVQITPNRFQLGSVAFFMDWDFLSIDYLRPIQVVEMAKTGDAENRMIVSEYGLRCKNEKGLGVATDLTTS